MPETGPSGPNPTPTATAAAIDPAAAGLAADIASFARHLAARNLAPRSIRGYVDAATLLDTFLAAGDYPRSLHELRRAHIEAFITDQLSRYKPATVHNRYRGLQAFFKWTVEEEMIATSPMVLMKPRSSARRCRPCSAMTRSARSSRTARTTSRSQGGGTTR